MKDTRGIISTYAHGILDYVIGLALLFAPNLFGFADAGGAAEIVPRMLGLFILAQALLTNYELGVVKLIPFRIHKTADIVLGLYLALSPFIHGFSDGPTYMWLPHVIVGAVIVGTGLMTRTYSATERRGDMRRAYT